MYLLFGRILQSLWHFFDSPISLQHVQNAILSVEALVLKCTKIVSLKSLYRSKTHLVSGHGHLLLKVFVYVVICRAELIDVWSICGWSR